MRILHVSASVAARDGGVTTAILGLHRGLLEAGHASVVLATDTDGTTAELSSEAVAELEAHGVHAYPASRPRILKNSWRQARAVLRLTRPTDVVLLHSLYLAHSVWAYLGARVRRAPYVIQPHGHFEPYQRGQSRGRKALWDAVIGRRIVRGAAAVLTTSEAEAEHVRARLPAKPVLVVPLGADLPEPMASPELRRDFAAWLTAPRERRVLFLGRLATKKRPDLAVRAWAEGPAGSTLAVVGPEEDHTHAELAALAPPDRQAALVTHDQVPPPAVAWLMREAGIFVLPSENENFGLAVAEALAAGCAVLTTTQTAAGEHVLAAGAGSVLDAPDLPQLAKELTALLDDAEGTRRAGERGAAYARSTLTWKAAAESLVAQLDGIG